MLRGSLITRLWAAPFPRVAGDLDLLGTYPHSVARTERLIWTALAAPLPTDAAPDGLSFEIDRCRARAIWSDSDFPGVRLSVSARGLGRRLHTTIDVGFGDPLVPAAAPVDYPLQVGGSARIWAVHPATLVGWKLHGLSEWGRSRWRPKDLHDLWLLLRAPVLCGTSPPDRLAEAIEVAFTSRGDTSADAVRVLADPAWQAPASDMRWRRFCEQQPTIPVPEDLTAVLTVVRDALAPALSRLSGGERPRRG